MGISLARARASCVSIAVAVALVLSGFGFAQAQATIDVAGSVTANDGTPIAGATIVLSSPGTSHRAVSDARGSFVFKSLPGGTYALAASAAGYESISQRTVTLDPNNTLLSISLSPATTNSLTVIGEVRASTGETVSTSSAPTATLDAQKAAAAGVPSVGPMIWSQLSTTPVLPLGGGSNATQTFAVRGPDPTETLVDIDGHPVNNGTTGDFDLSLVDPAALQDVQLVYGISPSSLIGPNTIGGGINIVTLQPTTTSHSLLRIFGGSYGTFGSTVQSTGSDGRFGYAFSAHGVTANGSVNQTILAPLPNGDPDDQVPQFVGSGSYGNSLLTKLRYQLGGPNGYGYLQFNFRNQNVFKDDSALLTNFTPPGFTGGGGDDAVHRSAGSVAARRWHDDAGGFQSFAGTTLAAHQSNYGFDAQLPLGDQLTNGAPANVLLYSHLTSLAAQSVGGPGAQTQPYLYNQRDLLGDDWLELDHHFTKGTLSLKYDLYTESLTTNFVQGQVIVDGVPIGPPIGPGIPGLTPMAGPTNAGLLPLADGPPIQNLALSQTQRSAVLRYTGDPSSYWHFAVAAYYSNDSTFGTSFDPRAGLTWTPTGNTAVRFSIGTTYQTPQLSELVVPPPSERVPIGGIVFVGNPNLKPDFATDYDLGAEQIFGGHGHALKLSGDLYQTNLRSPAAQLEVDPIPHCDTKRKPVPCPISMPVNAGNGIYRGIDLHAEQQLGGNAHVLAGWDVDSSYLTVIPDSIQDGTLVVGEQTLGQPLHKAYLAVENEPANGLAYGARLNYEGFYNELNRSPYATLDAHVAYRNAGFEYGLYGTNLTNVYADPFTVVGGGVLYGTVPGNPMITPNAFVLQGAQVNFVLTRAF